MNDIVKLLEESGVVQRGHFIGTQGEKPGMGYHLTEYVDKDIATSKPAVLRKLAKAIAALAGNLKVDVVVAPPMGALGIGLLVAEELNARYVFLEKTDDGLAVKRPSLRQIVDGANVWLQEDIINQGKTTLESIDAIQKAGGNIVAVSCIWNRGKTTAADLGVDNFLPLVNEELKRWTREECVQHGPCSKQVPVNMTPGHGKDYAILYPGYAGGFKK